MSSHVICNQTVIEIFDLTTRSFFGSSPTTGAWPAGQLGPPLPVIGPLER